MIRILKLLTYPLLPSRPSLPSLDGAARRYITSDTSRPRGPGADPAPRGVVHAAVLCRPVCAYGGMLW